MAKTGGRDKNIDGLRGLACISVVLIHTLFFPGEKIVPDYIKGMSLLIDVPLFFYIIGRSAVLSKVGGWNLSGIWKLLRIYYLLLIPLWIANCVFLGHISFKTLLLWMCQFYSNSDPFPAFMCSMWFILTYCVCLPVVQLVKSSPLAAKSIWLVNLSLLLILGFPHGGLLGGTRFAFDPATNLHLPAFAIPHTPLHWLFVLCSELLNVSWNFIFYLSFVLFGVLHQQGVLKRRMWGAAVLLGVAILCAYRFTGYGWLGNLQRDKFPPNMIYWSYSMLSISLLVFAAKYLGHFRAILAYWLPQWMGKNALYAYFAQGFTTSLLYVYVAHTNGMPLGIRMVTASLINLGLDILLVFLFIWVGRHLKKISFLQMALRRRGSGTPPLKAFTE